MNTKKVLKIVITVCIIIIAIDQLSKFLITQFVPSTVGNEYFGIEITENTGMAFGFNSGNTKNIFLSLVVIFIIISFIRNQREQLEPKVLVAIAMALGGGISNIIDRIFRGGVLDFIKILFIPNFNIADLCICIGWILIVVFLIIYTKKEDVLKTEK
ncbi:MAG: signal peptidase II [Clostridia bacterium]|nr:signal peptidase II [Clostridia bacterium]